MMVLPIIDTNLFQNKPYHVIVSDEYVCHFDFYFSHFSLFDSIIHFQNDYIL